MYYTDVAGLNPSQNSYAIYLLNKSTEIAKIMFSVQKKKNEVTFLTFNPVPAIT